MQSGIASISKPVLCHNNQCDIMHVIAFLILVYMIIFRSVNKANDITIITDSTTISKVCQNRSVLISLFIFGISIQLRKQYYCNVKFFCQGFKSPCYIVQLQVSVFCESCLGKNQLQIVNEDDLYLMSLYSLFYGLANIINCVCRFCI